MSRPPPVPRYPDPAYNGTYDPFATPAQSTQSHGRYEDSDMDHGYERRDTFQSEASHHDPRYYNQPQYDPYASRRDTDTESELEHPYPAQPYKSSNDSLLNQQRPAPSEVSTPTFNDYAPGAPREPYPAWGSDRQIPLSKEEIEDIFLDLTQKFGFQRDSMRNQFDFLMQLLDSRASRMTPEQALTTLHADYIGGPHANYRKWYFAAQLDLDDAVGQTQNPGVKRLQSIKRTKGGPRPATGAARSLESAINRWRQAMHQMSPYDRLRQIALYLLCWGEAAQRFMKFDKIDWNRAFFKTYKEKRTSLQLLVHFNRIWILHVSLFWYYTAYNSPVIYRRSGAADATAPMKWSASALGGAISTIIMIFATLAEFTFIPTTWNNTSHLSRRLIFLFIVLGLTTGPSFYVFIANDGSDGSSLPLILGIVQFFVAVIATLLFSIIPSGRMFGDRVAGKSRKYLASQTFTASYPSMTRNQRLGSIILWLLVFGCKGIESYYYLVLSFTETVRVMTHMKIQGCTDRLFGTGLCSNHAAFTLAIMFIMDLVLFFLDTYLWYVVWSAVLSTARSFVLGLSIWTPWKDIFTRLPKRIYAKILATGDMEVKYKPKVLVSQVWNAVIISMYREHLLSIDHVQKLLYHQVQSDTDGRRTLRAPPFFISQGDKMQGEFFPPGSEAARRISFFAQSLTTTVPEPLPVDAMPTFTVLTPHYSEKILLSLREIIREEDHNTRVTLLEYLKQLHPIEWENFVKDTKILAEESAMFNGVNPFGNGSDEKGGSNKVDDLPFYAVGFKSSSPEFTLRTRIWASLRAQTLYRTVSGMMNYAKAIKLLYRVENPEVVQLFGGNTEKLERELERMARRKFKFVVSMQRYSKFNKEEQENAEFLLRAYPDLQIAYLDEEPSKKEGGEPRLFSALIDGHSEFVAETGRRRPKFRIELPGNPILGDGKSDNQNHAIIFYRGEYLQLIDANQDNYLEECLKIRNVLGEFEEFHTSGQSPYAQWGHKDFQKSPVAIVGAREYIFSENIGILGDVAAGKEQTFGTLTARSLAWIGGKLHYGHPDFLNATFMATRGGVSKAQKGLHLNEDIFAGMNAFGRGGRIKHTEYFQCGKGRDLGFGTVLNFQTKLGNELTERGAGRAVLRLAKHFLSLSPMFEVFATQIQSNSILVNMSFGGARYIATGRGFATTRISFSILYSRFAGPSIYLGMRTLIMLLYVTMVLWVPHLLYFWISVAALVVAPFLFNPHQFSYSDFIIDYREFLRWMSRGNSRSHGNSWIGYCRLSRTQITGYKKKRLGHPSEKLSSDVPRAGWRAVLVSEIVAPLCLAIIFTIAYLFVKSFRQDDGTYPPSPLVRLAIVALGPIVWNAAVLLVMFLFSLTLGLMLNQCCPRFGAAMAMIAHSLAVVGLIAFFEFLWFLESWNAAHAVLGLIAIISIQRAIQKILISVFISLWLRPSKQIRAPLYSIKQKRQRRGIVIKFTIVFYLAFIIFAALIALPVIFRTALKMNCGICKSI
ncbi:1,3-beta-D-glucan synthase [Ceratobasidium sp. 423]|nr:1,3-beta-D-glucan synthase [Ceratobasidium sp. 423]